MSEKRTVDKQPLKCAFCDVYDMWQEINSHSESPCEFRAAMVHCHIIRGAKIRTITNYIQHGIGSPLRYCPECGRKLINCKEGETSED